MFFMTIGSYALEIPRMKKVAAKPKFLARFYAPAEMKFLMEKHFPLSKISEMFAAKMAFLNAMGIHARDYKLNEIAVLTDYSGNYYISLSGNSKKAFATKRCRVAVSCSHTRNIAMSTVVFYE